VRELRAQLRAVDIAVALPTGEVGIVLPSTSLVEATRVVARLRRLSGADEGLAPFATAHAGVVSLADHDANDASTLMGEARTRATRIQ
jgi:GGDEF domain-containing protein